MRRHELEGKVGCGRAVAQRRRHEKRMCERVRLPHGSQLVEAAAHVGDGLARWFSHPFFYYTQVSDFMMNAASHNTVPFSIERTLVNLPAEEEAGVRHALDELGELMTMCTPYSVRDDSRLAYRYARGEIRHMTPFDAVHEMACIQVLCDNTTYQAVMPEYLRALANQLKEDHFPSLPWTQVWKAVADLGPELLKTDLMYRTQLTFPEFCPPHAPMQE